MKLQLTNKEIILLYKVTDTSNYGHLYKDLFNYLKGDGSDSSIASDVAAKNYSSANIKKTIRKKSKTDAVKETLNLLAIYQCITFAEKDGGKFNVDIENELIISLIDVLIMYKLKIISRRNKNKSLENDNAEEQIIDSLLKTIQGGLTSHDYFALDSNHEKDIDIIKHKNNILSKINVDKILSKGGVNNG